MKYNQPRPGFELLLPCPFPMMITITPRAYTHIPVNFSWLKRSLKLFFWWYEIMPFVSLNVLKILTLNFQFGKQGVKSWEYIALAQSYVSPKTAVQRTSIYWLHHHHVVPLARISLTFSRHFSLSFITSGRSSGLHPVSSHSCCMYVWAGRPAFARPYVGVHRSTSLMSSSLLLQQCPACLVHRTWIVFMMGGRWTYSWCLVACCRQNLFKSIFFSSRLVSVQVVHPNCSIDMTAAWKKLRFILSVRSDFHMIDNLSIAVHAFVSSVSMSFSVDKTLLPR